MVTNSKPYKGLPMEGLIAAWYARTTRKDIKRHKLMAERLAPSIPAGGRVLEIAPGPGYFCIELARLGNYRITGLDISHSFVQIALRNALEAGLEIDFRQGNASDMPFPAGSFDFTFCQAAFKNFSEPLQAIHEMYRVLRPGGLAVIADLRRDATRQEIEAEVRGMQLDPINAAMVRWTFKNMLLKSAYSREQVQSFVARSPFEKSRIESSGIGFLLWLQKGTR